MLSSECEVPLRKELSYLCSSIPKGTYCRVMCNATDMHDTMTHSLLSDHPCLSTKGLLIPYFSNARNVLLLSSQFLFYWGASKQCRATDSRGRMFRVVLVLESRPRTCKFRQFMIHLVVVRSRCSLCVLKLDRAGCRSSYTKGQGFLLPFAAAEQSQQRSSSV